MKQKPHLSSGCFSPHSTVSLLVRKQYSEEEEDTEPSSSVMKEFVQAIVFVFMVFVTLVIFLSDSGNYVSIYDVSSRPSPSNSAITAPASGKENQTADGDPLIAENKTDIGTPMVEVVKKEEKRGIEKIELGLSRARASIRRAILSQNYTSKRSQPFIPSGSVYHNPNAFLQSYIEMEKRLKIFVYREGEPPLFHDGPRNYVYSSEGHFIHKLEEFRPFVTDDPQEATLFFLPLSIVQVVNWVYRPGMHEWEPMHHIVNDYVQVISTKYPYWNRTRGADHFIISCHDWAPFGTIKNHDLYHRSIRVLCNANTSEGFNPAKDVPLPEFNIRGGLPKPVKTPLKLSEKKTLAIFAGGNHGDIRNILLQQWKGKDSQVVVYEYLPKKMNYNKLLLRSKFCLCPSGYEVASPRIVEAMYTGCVPVTINDHYVLPFSDVLDWTQFSIQIPVSKIPEIKEILAAVPDETYLKLQKKVMRVQKHFLMNRPYKRFDAIGMLFHSIWLRRINVRLREL